MTIDWLHFTPWSALAGGALIGLAALFCRPVASLSLKVFLTASIADRRSEIPRAGLRHRHRKNTHERDADGAHHPLDKLHHGRPPRTVKITRNKTTSSSLPDHSHSARTREFMKPPSSYGNTEGVCARVVTGVL